MYRANPIKRAKIAIITFAIGGLGLAMSAQPLPVASSDALAAIGPIALPVAPAQAEVPPSTRRAWRDQIPAMFIVRRVRPS